MKRICLAFGLAASLAACSGDPLRSVPKLSEVELAEGSGQADVVAPEGAEASADTPLPAAATAPDSAPRRGLLGFLKGRADAAKEAPKAPAVVEDGAPDAVASDEVGSDSVVIGAETALAEHEAAEDQKQGGLFGFLKGNGAQNASGTQMAMVAPESDAPRRRSGGGLFGGGRSSGPKPGAPDYNEVSLGTDLPYGEMARVCGVSDSQLGRKAQTWPDGARNGYTLYDSAPGSSGQRTFYMTGFKDGCARQFSAALVMFGSPETWEQIHYGPAGSTLPVATTDSAYEGVKSSFCRVGKGQPCGSRMSALARSTVFVSVYQRFEDNTRWKNILLHDGEVVAMDVKG